MAFDAGAIVGRLALDSSKFTAGMQKSQKRAKKFGDVTKKIGGIIKKLAKSMVVAGAAVVGAIALMVRSYVKAGDEIHKMALRTGFSTEMLSGLKYAADISGASLDDLEKGVKKMSKTISDASKEGGALATYVRAFDRIGLSAEDLLKLSPEKQFEKITRAIAKLESPTLRAALAQEIFGRAGTKLLPLMALGAEGMDELIKKAEQLGLVWSQETADAAATLNDAITTLKGSFTGLKRNLVTELVPALTVVADHFTETFVGLQEESKTLASVIVGAFSVIVTATGSVLTGFKAFYISMLKLNKFMAESLIITLEELEYVTVMSKNYLLMAQVLPVISDRLAKLNKVRELDIKLIKEEEERLLKLVDFFKDLQLAIEAAGRAEKTFAKTTEDTIPPIVTSFATTIGIIFQAVLDNITRTGKDMSGVVGKAVTKMTGKVFEYEKTWQDTMREILASVGSVVGAMDSMFGQFHANEAMRLDNEEKQKTDAIEAWYESEQARLERTITNEEDLVAALEALDEKKARKENALQVKMDKERRKLERKKAKAAKVSALFTAGINVAEAITKALTAGPLIGQILSWIVAAMGAVQIAAIAASPLPALAEGAIFERPTYLVGEGRETEVLSPLSKLPELFDKTVGRQGGGMVNFNFYAPIISTTGIASSDLERVSSELFRKMEEQARIRGYELGGGV